MSTPANGAANHSVARKAKRQENPRELEREPIDGGNTLKHRDEKSEQEDLRVIFDPDLIEEIRLDCVIHIVVGGIHNAVSSNILHTGDMRHKRQCSDRVLHAQLWWRKL